MPEWSLSLLTVAGSVEGLFLLSSHLQGGSEAGWTPLRLSGPLRGSEAEVDPAALVVPGDFSFTCSFQPGNRLAGWVGAGAGSCRVGRCRVLLPWTVPVGTLTNLPLWVGLKRAANCQKTEASQQARVCLSALGRKDGPSARPCSALNYMEGQMAARRDLSGAGRAMKPAG